MTSAANKHTRRLDDEAMAWIARLSNDAAGEQEYLEFALWLEVSPEHKQAYDRAEALWLDLGCVKYAPAESASSTTQTTQDARSVTRAAPQDDQPQADKAERPLWQRGRSIVAAASVAMAISIVAVVSLQQGEVAVLHQQALSTKVGEQAAESLPDGSSITLNTNTELTIRYTDTERKVELLKGEAHFVVAKEESRPFVVTIPDGEVTAVGTAFNIEIEPQHTLVTVTEGVVRINEQSDRAHHADTLVAREGDQVDIDPLEGMSRSHVSDLSDFTAWQNNELVFRKARLATVVAELNRYTETKIKIADRGLTWREVSGVFKLDKPMETLEAIESSLGLKSKQQGQIILLYDQG